MCCKLWVSLFVRSGDDGGYETTGGAVVAELAEVDALPDAEVQTAAGNGQRQRGAYYYRFGVRRHVVRPFVGVQVTRGVFRHESVEDQRKVVAHVGVGVLVERQCGRRVLYQQVEQSLFGQRRQLAQDVAGHQVYAARVGAQRDFCLFYHKCAFLRAGRAETSATPT